MLDSFDKGWFVLQTYSGYENKVKENLLQRAQTYNMLENTWVKNKAKEKHTDPYFRPIQHSVSS